MVNISLIFIILEVQYSTVRSFAPFVSNCPTTQLVQIQPFIHQFQGSSRKTSCNDSVFNGNYCFVIVVPYMKMRRLMLIHIHINDYSIKTAYFRHIFYFEREIFANALCYNVLFIVLSFPFLVLIIISAIFFYYVKSFQKLPSK